MKMCSHCGLFLDESQFNWKIKNVRLATHCKDCSRKYIRNHYKNNVKYYLEKAKKSNLERRRIAHEYVGAYLATHACVDCGEADIVVLEFDHKDRNDKKGSIGEQLGNKFTMETLIKEIKKCEVRCANCHRRKTARESNSWRLTYAPVA